MHRRAYTHQRGTGGSLQRQTPAYCSAEHRRGSSISCMYCRDCMCTYAGRYLCRPHIRQIPSVYIQTTLSNNISSVSTHNLYRCKLMRSHRVFSATFGRCKTLLARAAASYEIVHTPHIDRADSAGPDYSQLYFTHTSPDER